MQIIPCRLQFYRMTELMPSQKMDEYYILGEYDYLQITEGLTDPTQVAAESTRPRPASSVPVNWSPPAHTHDKPISHSDFWDKWRLVVDTAFFVRIDFGATPDFLPELNSIDAIISWSKLTSPEHPTNWVSNQLEYIEEAYRRLEGISCYQGIGAYSVYVLIDGARHDLRDALQQLKSIMSDNGTYRVATTTTMALVRGVHEVSAMQQKSSEGKWHAQLLITCPSMDGRILADKVTKIASTTSCDTNGDDLFNVLGDFDYSIRLHDKTLRELALISLGLHEIPGLYARTTLEWSNANAASQDSIPAQPSHPQNQVDLTGLLEVVSSLRIAPSGAHGLATFRSWQSELCWIISHVQLALRDPSMQLHFSDILAIIADKVIPQLAAVGKLGATDRVGLDTTLEILANAVTQRKQPRLLPPLDYPLAETTITQGSNLVLRAITRYVESLFRYAHGVLHPGDDEDSNIKPYWKSVAVFDYEDGFLYYPNHLFTLPFAAALRPCSAGTSWQTLSHEVAHAISVDERLLQTEQVRSAIDRLSEFLTDVDDMALVEHQIAEVLRADFVEIAAHWLDYYLFYRCNIDRYLRGVWATWRTRPGGRYQKIQEKAYLIRSFVIYCESRNKAEDLYRDFDGIYSTDNMPPDKYYKTTELYLGHDFESFCLYVKGILPNDVVVKMDGYKDAILLAAAHQLWILGAAKKTLSLSTSPPEWDASCSLDSIVDALKNGCFVDDDITSPIALLQELHQHAIKTFSEGNEVSDSTQVALIYVLANNRFQCCH